MNHSSHFQSDAQTYTYKNRFEKPLEIFGSAEAFSSDSDEVHLVADAFGQAEELGFRQRDLPKVRKLSAPTNLRVQILQPLLHRMLAVEWILILTMVESRKGIYDNSCRVAAGYK